MDIKIGNDIKIDFVLDTIKNTKANVKQLQCYLVNTTASDAECCEPKCCCNHGLPNYCINPHFHLNTCGVCGYHFWPIDRACRYMGFGLAPHFAKCPKKKPEFKYNAFCKPLFADNSGQAYFPAIDQKLCGEYKFMVEITTFEYGWGEKNLHTYTIDYGTLFNLVEDGGISGDIIIDANTKQQKKDIDDDTLPGFEVVLNSNETLKVGEFDLYNRQYIIRMRDHGGVMLVYNRSKDQLADELSFEIIEGGEYVTVNEIGTIHALSTPYDVAAVMRVTFKEDPTIYADCDIAVVGTGENYIGYYYNDESPTPASMSDIINHLGRYSTDELDNSITITSPFYGSYLWICTKQEVDSATVDGFDVPLVSYPTYEGLYIYKCPNPIMGGVTVNLKLTLR